MKMPFRRRPAGDAQPAFSSPAAAPRHGSVQQAHFRIAAIERDTIRLHGHEYRALVECVGVAVHTLPPNEQEATLAGYASFLNALPFPTQLQVRIQRRSLEPHIRAVRRAAQGFEGRRDTGALSRVAEGYLRYLTGLHDQAVLLDRRCYVVVPADPRVVRAALPVPEPAHVRLLSWLTSRSRRDEEEEEAELEAERAAGGPPADPRDAVFSHLQFRCEQVVRLLSRSGMQAWRVSGPALYHAVYACWNPEAARLYPLDPEQIAALSGNVAGRSLVAQQRWGGGPATPAVLPGAEAGR
jgi:hypothetical protein